MLSRPVSTVNGPPHRRDCPSFSKRSSLDSSHSPAEAWTILPARCGDDFYVVSIFSRVDPPKLLAPQGPFTFVHLFVLHVPFCTRSLSRSRSGFPVQFFVFISPLFLLEKLSDSSAGRERSRCPSLFVLRYDSLFVLHAFSNKFSLFFLIVVLAHRSTWRCNGISSLPFYMPTHASAERRRRVGRDRMRGTREAEAGSLFPSYLHFFK